MSEIKVDAITDAAGGNTATINGMTPTADSLQGFRNRIINGDMRIDQRNAGASVAITASAQYTVDRWQVQNVTDGTLTSQQVADAPAGFVTSLLLTVGTADSSLSAAQLARVWQVVEANNVSDFSLGTASAVSMSLSFWVKSSLTGTFGGNLSGGTSLTNSYVFTYTINAVNIWEYKTVSVPAATIGTWLTGNNAGIALVFDLGAGSNFQKAAGSWGTGQYAQATASSTSLIGSAGATLNITGVQLEAGSVATPFERRDYGRELIMCQRYYETGDFSICAATPAAGTIGSWVPFVVTKRASATLTTVLSVGSSGNTNVNAVGFRREAAPDANGRVIGTFTASAEL